MRNKKGFTLVELLVVIALIAIITTSISVAMFEMLQSQKDKIEENSIKNIENAACTYAELNDLRNNCTDKNNCEQNINISNLILDGKLDEEKYDKYKEKNVIIKWEKGLKTCTFKEE